MRPTLFVVHDAPARLNTKIKVTTSKPGLGNKLQDRALDLEQPGADIIPRCQNFESCTVQFGTWNAQGRRGYVFMVDVLCFFME